MDERKQQLSELRSYIGRVEKDTTLAVQALQWDPRRLLEDDRTTTKSTKDESSRRLPGYDEFDVLLPDDYSDTAIKLSSANKSQIIRAAALNDPSFKMGEGDPGRRPVAQSAGRLQSTYTRDERRALYDAVVARAPPAPAAPDLPSLPGDGERTKPKSFLEVMAQLRDMKRRRTKYKVPTKSKNYSQVLREVIKNQMELFTGIKEETDTNNLPNYVSSSSSLFHQNQEIKQERPSEPREEINRSNEKHSKHDKPYRHLRDYHHEHKRDYHHEYKNEKYSEKSSYYSHNIHGKPVEHYADRDSQSNGCRSSRGSREKNTHLDKIKHKDKHAESEAQARQDSDSNMSQDRIESHKLRDHGDYRYRKLRDHRHYSSRESRDCKDKSYRESRDHRKYSSLESRDHNDHSSQDSREDMDHSSLESRYCKDYSSQKLRNQSSRESREHRNYSSCKTRDRKDHSSIESRDSKDYISRESPENRGHSSHGSQENKFYSSRHHGSTWQRQDNKNYKPRDHRSPTSGKGNEAIEIKQVKLEPGEL